MLSQYRAVSVPTSEPYLVSPVRDGQARPVSRGFNPRVAFRRYVHYCRTKHVVPLNWSFYLRRFGLVDGIKRHRYWKKHGLKNGFRPLYFKHREEIPPEFIRLDPWEMSYVMWAGSKARLGVVEVGRFNGGSTLIFAVANADVPMEWDQMQRLRGVSEGDMTRFAFPKLEPLAVELSEFCRAVLGHEAAIVTLEDGLAAVELADRLEQVTSSGERTE